MLIFISVFDPSALTFLENGLNILVPLLVPFGGFRSLSASESEVESISDFACSAREVGHLLSTLFVFS